MREELAILAALGGGSALQSAAEDPDHDRQLAGLGIGRGPDVEGQAVLGGSGVVKHHVAEDGRLHAVVAEVVRGTDASPRLSGSRRCPAQLAGRWRGVGDALEGHHLSIGSGFALYGSLVGLDLGRNGGEDGGGDEKQGSGGKSFATEEGHGLVSAE